MRDRVAERLEEQRRRRAVHNAAGQHILVDAAGLPVVNANPEGHNQYTKGLSQAKVASGKAMTATDEVDKRFMFSTEKPSAATKAFQARIKGDSSDSRPISEEESKTHEEVAALHDKAADFHEQKAASGRYGRPVRGISRMSPRVKILHKDAARLHRVAAEMHRDAAAMKEGT